MFSQSKIKIIRVLLVILLLAGAWYWFNQYQKSTVASQAEYIDTVRPWLRVINDNYSLEQVASVRDNLLYLKSQEKSVGEGHLSLFFAFDAWQQYLESNNPALQQKANKFFEQAIIALPPLNNDIKRLQKILLGDV